MPRKPKARTPSAGEVVSFFEELPVEFATIVFDIVRVRLEKRRTDRDGVLMSFSTTADKDARKPKGAKKAAKLPSEQEVREAVTEFNLNLDKAMAEGANK